MSTSTIYNSNKQPVDGSVGILKTEENIYGLYYSYRTQPDEDGNITIVLSPIFDENGKHVLLKGVHDCHIPKTNYAIAYTKWSETIGHV